MPNAQFDIDIEAMLKNVNQLEAFRALPEGVRSIVLQQMNHAVFAASLRQENMIAGAAILCPPGQHKDKTTRKCVDDNDTAVVESEPPAAAEAATAEAAADPDPKAAQFAEDDVVRKTQIEAAAKAAAELAATRAINYYARIRPFLKMDQGATAAQGMQAEGETLRTAAEATAENIDKNFCQNFKAPNAICDGGGTGLDASARFKVSGHQCIDFQPVFEKDFKTFHGHETGPNFKPPTKPQVGFNLVWDDRPIYEDTRHGDENQRIKQNNDEFLVSVWPNVEFFFGSETRPASNVIYVAYGASGAGKTTTTAAILARWLAKVAEKKTMANYSIRIVSDYLNRCYDFLSPEAEAAYEALRQPKQTGQTEQPDSLFHRNDKFVEYLLNEQLVVNKKTKEAFFNAHAISADFNAGANEGGKALLKSQEAKAKQVAEAEPYKTALKAEKKNPTKSNVGKALFREGNAKFAIGYAVNQNSPSEGIEVKRTPAGAVDTAEYLTQFHSRKLSDILKSAQASDDDGDSGKQADKLWTWLETRINVFRRRGNTGLNKTSSRSHVLYIITDDTKTDATAPGKILCLADFAGTEELSFLVPKATQEMAQEAGHKWFSVALPSQQEKTLTNQKAKDLGAVPLVMGMENRIGGGPKLVKQRVPAQTITQLAKATFIQEATSKGLPAVTNQSVEALWTKMEPIHFLSKQVMQKLPPLQQESHNITRSLEEFKKFLQQHRTIVQSKGTTSVDCTQFTIDHHRAIDLNKEKRTNPIIGFQRIQEPCLLVQKLLCPLVTLDSSLVVLGAFAPRATDDLNSYNTASFISDCGCGDGKMKCQA